MDQQPAPNLPQNSDQTQTPINAASPLQTPQDTVQPTQNKSDGLGIAALVLAFFIPLVGLILGVISKTQSKKAGQKNTIATAAIIVSSTILVLATLFFIFIFGSMLNKCKQLGPGVHYENGTTYTCS